MQYRLSRLITLGTVTEADYDTARVKVTIGEWTSGWLPWLTTRAKNDLSWWALEVGEQVLVVSPCGDMAQGVVIGSLYQQQQQHQLLSDVNDIAVEERHKIQRIKYKDGTVIEYDSKNHRLKADVKGDVEINATGDVVIDVKGNMTATVGKDVLIKANNITLQAAGDMTLKAAGKMKLNAAHISAQE